MNQIRQMRIAAEAEWVRQMDEKAKRDRGEQIEAGPKVDISGMNARDAIAATFGTIPPQKPPANHDRPPEPAPAAPAAAPAEPLDGAPPARLSDVLASLTAAPAAAAPVTPSAQVRAVLASLPDDQRQALESVVAERMGGLSHLGESQADYKRALLVGWMSGRVADARRLSPDASAADVLTSLLPVAPSGDPAGEQGAGLP